MKKLLELHDRFGQSPWLDGRGRIGLGRMSLARWLAYGIRGVTSNSAIRQDAFVRLSGDNHLRSATDEGLSIDSIYQRVLERAAFSSLLLRPVYEESAGSDGFVSVGIPPRFARDSEAMVRATTDLYRRIAQPNLMVEIPATSEGVSAVRGLISGGRSVNVTLIASLTRYEQVIDAYLAGLESFEGSLSRCHSLASFSLRPVDAEVDRRLEAIRTHTALSLRGKVALAQAKIAYRMFEDRFFGARWQTLVMRGAKVQRLLWSWTTVQSPAYPDLLYVENLVGPNTVSALSQATIAALEDHGSLARSVDRGLDEAEATLDRLARVGVDLAEVGQIVERDAVSAWSSSDDRLLGR